MRVAQASGNLPMQGVKQREHWDTVSYGNFRVPQNAGYKDSELRFGVESLRAGLSGFIGA